MYLYFESTDRDTARGVRSGPVVAPSRGCLLQRGGHVVLPHGACVVISDEHEALLHIDGHRVYPQTVLRLLNLCRQRHRIRIVLHLVYMYMYMSPFSPLETISTSLWASLRHQFPVLSVFSHVSCHFIFSYLPICCRPSPCRPLPPSLPRYNQVHHFFLRGCLLLFS